MKTIKLGCSGADVEDIQQRLLCIGLLDEAEVTGTFDEPTAKAVRQFCEREGLAPAEEITTKLWAALVDATYNLGDRTLYLRMPYFHGHDVRQLQQALGALGFAYGKEDAIFGASTEHALRKFQLNLGLPSDGIAGAYTYAALRRLHHSWEGKSGLTKAPQMGFARAADVLEEHAVCIFGADEFTRSVASRMSNLALATNPLSRMVSADALSVPPSADTIFLEVVCGGGDSSSGTSSSGGSLGGSPLSASSSDVSLDVSSNASSNASSTPTQSKVTAREKIPEIEYSDDETLAKRISGGLQAARRADVQAARRADVQAVNKAKPVRIRIILPHQSWMDAGPERSAQHYAITLLDALCSAL